MQPRPNHSLGPHGTITSVSSLQWLLVLAGAAFAAYAGLVLWLIRAGRREDAVAIARFVPDCVILFRRLLADGRVPRRTKLLLVGSSGTW